MSEFRGEIEKIHESRGAPRQNPGGDPDLAPGQLALQILGEDGIHFEDRQNERLAPQAAELLAFVHLSHRREVRRPAVLRALWPELDVRTARRRLSRLLWRCQQVLPYGVLTVRGESIAVDDRLYSDHQCAGATIDRILAGERRQDGELLVLHRRLLTDVVAEWTNEHRLHWDRRRTQALEKATETLLQHQQIRSALLHASYLSEWQPLNENAQQLLFHAFLADGAPGKALKSFHEYRRTLRRELGAEPSADFRELARTAELGLPNPSAGTAEWRRLKGSQIGLARFHKSRP
ncbi:AfsR/SARP family transcriptional regulator [Streptomyces erythrochromogenes]|uniref:AfsR/SARP family transcriptional regulator n=1 Tax=Streptomyces erythrochromogenes TaxID=285574 RepID=UPI0036C9340F